MPKGERGSSNFGVLRNDEKRKFSNGRHFETVKHVFFFADKQGLMTSINGVILCINSNGKIVLEGVGTYPTPTPLGSNGFAGALKSSVNIALGRF